MVLHAHNEILFTSSHHVPLCAILPEYKVLLENWSYPGVASQLASQEATQGSGWPPGNPTQGQ